MDNNQCAAEYYRTAALQKETVRARRPSYVPRRVRVLWKVRGDGPFADTYVEAGEYDCTSNQYGAVRVKATNGKDLGLRLDEFEPIAWRENDLL